MTLIDMMKLIASVAASFGVGAVIVVALTRWLGSLWASRILQGERANLEKALSDHVHELGLAKSSYESYLELILDYYAMFYDQYRLCQRVAGADAYRHKDTGVVTHTKEEFLSKLDGVLEDWSQREGRIRLLLPASILETHMNAISAFNKFKRSVESFDNTDKTRSAKEEAFVALDAVKNKMESQLRGFLRTENLLK